MSAPVSAAMKRAGAGDGAPGGYGRWIAIDITHGYHNGGGRSVAGGGDGAGACRHLRLQPTARTAARLARFGLLTRPRPDGFDLLAPASHAAEASAALAAAARKGSPASLFGPPLLFTLTIVAPEFLNVTRMPEGFGSGERMLLLSTVEASADGPGRARVEVDWERSSGSDAASTPVAAPGGWWWESEAEVRSAREERVAVASQAPRLTFGLLELHPPPPRADEPLAALRYEIRFEARRTRWRYLVVDPAGTLDVDRLKVLDADPAGAVFTAEASAREGPGGGRTAAFLSDSAIPLLERPAARFRLEGVPHGGRRSARSLVDPLPSPSADAPALRRDGAELSEIYVFV